MEPPFPYSSSPPSRSSPFSSSSSSALSALDDPGDHELHNRDSEMVVCYRLDLAPILPDPLGMQTVSLCFHNRSPCSDNATVVHFTRDDIVVTTSPDDPDTHDAEQGYVISFDPVIVVSDAVEIPRHPYVSRLTWRVCASVLIALLVGMACSALMARCQQFYYQTLAELPPRRVMMVEALHNVTKAYDASVSSINMVHLQTAAGEEHVFWPTVALDEYLKEAIELCYRASQADPESSRQWCRVLVDHLTVAHDNLVSASVTTGYMAPWFFRMLFHVRDTITAIELARDKFPPFAGESSVSGKTTAEEICDAFLDQMPSWNETTATMVTTLEGAHAGIVAASLVAPAIYEKFIVAVGQAVGNTSEPPPWWVEDVLYSLTYLTSDHQQDAEAVADTTAKAIADIKAAHSNLADFANYLEQVKAGAKPNGALWYFDNWDTLLLELEEVSWNVKRRIGEFSEIASGRHLRNRKGLRPSERRWQALKRQVTEDQSILEWFFQWWGGG
ncbi:hypothetical protein CH063_00037 [Colletotrichum higginsianum]|uniref:Uncharacterized protein n=2 Tax=Colletotrichum higginsianum TaxID=80884 RepID=H1VH77_COLHI|nr:hypothetical protein CH63R_03523 [Colletotrichum higginsianum IMI 349063]OBR14797.1 hypothetical protein CH63R_03523 [Colletotrichum higginsianum IMI 349063]TID01648.1 hypothetical protein CH35J_004879 [Colletotrichum higginsianum]CCF39580.1 hypothetical protein CH063_00037 [Colletotrichum higginsianum]